MKRKAIRYLVILALLGLLALLALDERLIVRRYELERNAIDAPVRLAVLSDFHGGHNGAELLRTVGELQPDAILLPGDMFSSDGNPEEELAFFRQLTDIAPTYYVTGNHEYWEYDVPALCARIRQTGVTVLDQTCATLTLNGQALNLCGVPDPYAGVDTGAALTAAIAQADPTAYTILLAHRPELIGTYAETGNFDLVLSGHAHGGQIRLPGLINGLYAPNQGWFPAYAGGRYQVEDTVLIVSRGLRVGHIPRIFNRPEVLLVVLE